VKPDFERAKKYALKRLKEELDTQLSYHSISHTRDDVVPAAERLADLAGVSAEDKLLLLTAAWFHDLGNIEQVEGHEDISVRIAEEVLPEMGYSPEQIEIIRGIILATRLPQSPMTLLEMIMADADLDLLGSEDFWPNNQFLHLELDALGKTFSEEEWYSWQLKFLQEHEYFTAEARVLRDEGKEKNIQLLITALERFNP
jgi:uncharacterized protein